MCCWPIASLLAPIEAAWRAAAREHGRPTIAMATFVRLMVVKQRTGWGYETLVREVSDSLHLRRFCLIALSERVPDESTIRKLVRRLGPDVVDEITRAVIGKAQRETRFVARAVRIDSTVVEADVRYPSDAVLALHGARALAREGRKLARRLRRPGAPGGRIARGRSAGPCARSPHAGAANRASAASEVIALNAKAGRAMARSVARGAPARRPGARGGARPRRRRPSSGRARARRAGRSLPAKVATQIEQRLAGEKITDRLVSIADPDARPIRKGKLGKPNEFGYVAQIAEVTANTRRGARGYVLPAPSATGNAGENTLLATTAAELERLKLRPREVALRRRASARPCRQDQLAAVGPERVFVAGRHEPGSRRTRKRLARYRTGAEGRISHLKRGYGLRRSRLKGHNGQRIWTGWAILTYNLDTLAVHTT